MNREFGAFVRIRNRPVRHLLNAVATRIGGGPWAFPPLPADGRILFRVRDRRDYPFLSNFYPAVIEIDGTGWATVEHYYQAQKSFDVRYRELVRRAESPGMAKRLGAASGSRRVVSKSWFALSGESPRSDWNAVKLNVMERAVHSKFDQHRRLALMLLATADWELIEDSPHDAFWGAADGCGMNHLGQILMRVRNRLRTTNS